MTQPTPAPDPAADTTADTTADTAADTAAGPLRDVPLRQLRERQVPVPH